MPMIAEMIVEVRKDEIMIAGTIVAVVEAMGMYTGTLKTNVGVVALISSHTCYATVVVLIITVPSSMFDIHAPVHHFLHSAHSF